MQGRYIVVTETIKKKTRNGASTANEYKLLAVMIDNSEAACPQHGLQAADVGMSVGWRAACRA